MPVEQILDVLDGDNRHPVLLPYRKVQRGDAHRGLDQLRDDLRLSASDLGHARRTALRTLAQSVDSISTSRFEMAASTAWSHPL